MISEKAWIWTCHTKKCGPPNMSTESPLSIGFTRARSKHISNYHSRQIKNYHSRQFSQYRTPFVLCSRGITNPEPTRDKQTESASSQHHHSNYRLRKRFQWKTLSHWSSGRVRPSVGLSTLPSPGQKSRSCDISDLRRMLEIAGERKLRVTKINTARRALSAQCDRLALYISNVKHDCPVSLQRQGIVLRNSNLVYHILHHSHCSNPERRLWLRTAVRRL